MGFYLEDNVFGIWNSLDQLRYNDLHWYKKRFLEPTVNFRTSFSYNPESCNSIISDMKIGGFFQKELRFQVSEFLYATIENIGQHASEKKLDEDEIFGLEKNHDFQSLIMWNHTFGSLSVYVMDSGRGFRYFGGDDILLEAHQNERSFGENGCRGEGSYYASLRADEYAAFSLGRAVFKEEKQGKLRKIDYPFSAVPKGALICANWHR